jgi:thiamine-monophosphate kinase
MMGGAMNEDARIARWVKAWPPGPAVLCGPGDDCALVAPPPRGAVGVLKTDAVLEGVHFTRRDPPRWVGRKALARAVSDFAAMGAVPSCALVACLLPGDAASGRWMDAAMRGMAAAGRRWGIGLAGGETTRGPRIGLTVMLHGWVERGRALRRGGARAGDVLMVTGRLGGSIRGRHLRFEPRLAEGRWLGGQRGVRAMMDLSDGLGRDLPRLAAASGLSFHLDPARLPRDAGCTVEQAVNDGEDYELLIAAAPSAAEALRAAWPFRTRLTGIGRLLPPSARAETGGVTLVGYDHFS